MEITRLKEDLKTIEEAVGCEPEFNRRQVWRCIGFGFFGLAVMLWGIVDHEVPRWLGASVIGVFLFGLPAVLPRIFCPGTPRLASTADRDVNSWGVCCLITGIFGVGFLFWQHKLGLPLMLAEGFLCLLFGAEAAAWTWRRPWRRFAQAWALSLIALGFVLPFFHGEKRFFLVMFGIAWAIGSFTGAVILDHQLKEHDADGKSAH